MSEITGATLIGWGYKPGKWFKEAIETANRLRAEGAGDDAIAGAIAALMPVQAALRATGPAYGVFLDADTPAERDNAAAVAEHMDALMRIPTIVAGAVMPDACPTGSAKGTIPVGGAVACHDAIHPGFHSADICCSLAMTVFGRADEPSRVLDAVQALTHFGPGGRTDPVQPPAQIMESMSGNSFLAGLEQLALRDFATQGDGNHFAYVGRLASTGQTVLVTHHGSRGLGAQLYKRGMAFATRHTAVHAPDVPSHNAWIQASSQHGRAYWEALQVVRAWTKASHFAIHDVVAEKTGNKVADRFWNEHNFVFQRADGLFYHGKGATPSWPGFSADDDGRTLIPLNMAEPILIVSHKDRSDALGFAPHGAGRNLSRTAYMRSLAGRPAREVVAEQTKGIDVRFFCGSPDLSELPGAYKSAAAVRHQIVKFGLAEVIDTIEPAGCIMAGDWEQDAPWRKKRKATIVSDD